jgi:hypothetical protein
MSDFQVTDNSKDAAYNARMFVKEHKDDLKALVKAIFPYLFLLIIVTLFVNYFMQMNTIEFMKENRPSDANNLQESMAFLNDVQKNSFSHPLFWFAQVINIGFAYLFAVIAVSWHRLVLLGRDRYEPMEVLSPKAHEVNFIILWTFIGVIVPLIVGFIGNISLITIGFSSIVLPYILFKISFYFPAKALDSHISFSDSYRLTSGYFWKMMLTSIRSFWRLVLVFILLMAAFGFVSGVLAVTVFNTDSVEPLFKGAYTQVISQQFQVIIGVLFFQPLFTVLGVTILSNYYQHALRHKPSSGDEAV